MSHFGRYGPNDPHGDATSERTVRARALADRLADERDKLSTPSFYATSEAENHAWQAGYQYGLSRAREVIVHQHLDEMLEKDVAAIEECSAERTLKADADA